ncbi:MAG: DNA helicase RecQ [Epsilonproteobacteria bacterium]|nr:DNA helicase RecQ [Campylobacterota bacterium]
MKKHEILEKIFGHSAFRQFQEEAVDAIVSGQDLLMILPTGGGKSLCYQLPALMMDGVSIVVSPLIALMQDQVRGLSENGIEARTIHSDMTQEERVKVFQELKSGSVKLLYVSPERLVSPNFLTFLNTLKINFFVIDEAHCVSEWGHEFRADYRKLHLLKAHFPQVPIAAFTATATPKVADDIHKALQLKDPVSLRGSVFRQNLKINSEKRISNGRAQLVNFLNAYKGESGIVYTFTRKEAEQVATFLQSKNFSAKAYHARIDADEKERVYHDFLYEKIDIVVATIAFGMGIDKSNIRFVVHTSLPKTIENYYQEIGRAGRDGLESETLLLFTKSDEMQKRELVQSVESDTYKEVLYEKLQKMYNFALSSVCKHKLLGVYFGDVVKDCEDHCISCLKPPVEQIEITKEAQQLISAIYRMEQKFGQNHVIDVLRGSEAEKVHTFEHHKLSVHGIGKGRGKAEWEMIFDRLFELEMIGLGDHRTVRLLEKSKEVLTGGLEVWIDEDKIGKMVKSTYLHDDTPKDAMFEAFRTLRIEIATEHQIPAYMVFSDKTLLELSQRLPQDKEEMLEVHGIGEVKYERYGEAFLERSKELSQSK